MEIYRLRVPFGENKTWTRRVKNGRYTRTRWIFKFNFLENEIPGEKIWFYVSDLLSHAE